MSRKVAISACLMGCHCRYDGRSNHNQELLTLFEKDKLIAFCPEDSAFGTPRPTMDLVESVNDEIVVLSNEGGENLLEPILSYAQNFFRENPDIELFIGKDRSPSCAVASGKVYDVDKNLLHTKGSGIMAQVAIDLGIEAWGSELYLQS